MKFLADRNLGKLVKWLRILGYDTVYDRGSIDRAFLDRGSREGRCVLTKRKDMVRRNYRGRMLVVLSDDLPGQLREVIVAFELTPDRSSCFTRCLICNEALREADREEAASFVPPYVYQTHQCFQKCPACGRYYWAGTHRENILDFLKGVETAGLEGVGPR